MTKYSENPGDLTLLAEYGQLLSEAVEMDEAFEQWDDGDLNDSELNYYLELNNRVMQKLIEVMG